MKEFPIHATESSDNYNDGPHGGDLMGADEWELCVITGLFIDYDGFGYHIRDGKVINENILPSKRADYEFLPGDMIEWFNK